MLTCFNLSCERNNKIIFSSLGFTLGEGSCLTIRGKNGSGKTSLLKMIAGLLPPIKGNILWNDQDISKIPYEFSSQMVYLGHKNALNNDLNTEENLKFWALFYNNIELLELAIKFFNLEKIRKEKISVLSNGWQRRIALSRIMLANAKLWLLDEPFTNLDEQAIEIILTLIASRCDSKGIVIITHHGENILPFGDNIKLDEYTNLN